MSLVKWSFGCIIFQVKKFLSPHRKSFSLLCLSFWRYLDAEDININYCWKMNLWKIKKQKRLIVIKNMPKPHLKLVLNVNMNKKVSIFCLICLIFIFSFLFFSVLKKFSNKISPKKNHWKKNFHKNILFPTQKISEFSNPKSLFNLLLVYYETQKSFSHVSFNFNYSWKGL